MTELAARISREIRHMWRCQRELHGGMAAIIAIIVVIDDHGGIIIPGVLAMSVHMFLVRDQHRNPSCPKWDDTKESVTLAPTRRGRVRHYQGPARVPTSKIGTGAVHAMYCWPLLVFWPCIAIAVALIFFDDFLLLLPGFALILAAPFVVGAVLPHRHRNERCPKLLAAPPDASRHNRSSIAWLAALAFFILSCHYDTHGVRETNAATSTTRS